MPDRFEVKGAAGSAFAQTCEPATGSDAVLPRDSL